MKNPLHRILIVDDEANLLRVFKKVLEGEGYEIETASSGEEALRLLETETFHLVLSDLKMPGMDGLELIKKGKPLVRDAAWILMTAFAAVDSVITAIKEGAHDYLTKPIHNEELKIVVQRALEHYRLAQEVERLRSQIDIGFGFQEIIGKSKPMQTVLRLVRTVARSQSTILIQGESGTGKELIARAIHQQSPRSGGPFVAVDCGALPETLLESELFGHLRGAFTGAVATKRGLFEEAHGGTLFLDEIGGSSLTFQPKLLRTLQEGEVRPVGSSKSVKVDVRVVAATNRDLKEEVAEKRFREDLFYRLSVVPIVLPPLRERKEDIPILARHFIEKYCCQNEIGPKRLSPAALKVLLEHTWPGNVRELEHAIERGVLLSPREEISPEVLFHERESHAVTGTLRDAMRKTRGAIEREKISEALRASGGKRSRAARLLGISRTTLYERLKRYGFAQ